MRFVARWLANPASLNTAVAGTRQHRGKQGIETNGKPDIKKAHGSFPCFVCGTLGRAFGSIFFPRWLLVSARPANAADSFQSVMDLDLQKRICWHQPSLVADDIMATSRK